MTPSAVNCSTKYTVFSHALHFCCVPANAIAPSHTTAVVFFFVFCPLRRSEEEEEEEEKKKARTKVKRKIKPQQKQRYLAAAASFSTLPPRRCCFPSQAQQKTEFGSNARERTREESLSLSLSLSLYRRRRSSRPRLHSVNADTVNTQHRLGFSFFSIFFFSFFGGLGVPVIYLFIYLVISVLCFREFFDFSKILKAFFGRIYF
jgi:hypothetical protein